MSTAIGTSHRIESAIRATPRQVWDALVDGTVTPAYYYGFTAEFDLTPGSAYRYHTGGQDQITGTVVAVDPGLSLVTTFNGTYSPEASSLPETTVTFTVSDSTLPIPGITLLTIEHEGFPDAPSAAAAIDNTVRGWVVIASGLKTLLETGSPLVVPPGA